MPVRRVQMENKREVYFRQDLTWSKRKLIALLLSYALLLSLLCY